MGANEKLAATFHPDAVVANRAELAALDAADQASSRPLGHTPTVERDKLGHPWQVCTTCGARSSVTLTSVCPGPKPAQEVRGL